MTSSTSRESSTPASAACPSSRPRRCAPPSSTHLGWAAGDRIAHRLLSHLRHPLGLPLPAHHPALAHLSRQLAAPDLLASSSARLTLLRQGTHPRRTRATHSEHHRLHRRHRHPLRYLPRLSRLNAAALYTTASFFTFCSLPVLSHFIGFTRVNFRDATHAQAEDCPLPSLPPSRRTRACPLHPHHARRRLYRPGHRASQLPRPAHLYRQRPARLRIFWNDVRLYFLSGRPSITRWYDLHPGIQTTRPIQNEIIQAIERNHPPVVALNYTWDDTIEPNQSQYSSGVTALDDYIRSHYIPQASYGKIIILAPSR